MYWCGVMCKCTLPFCRCEYLNSSLESILADLSHISCPNMRQEPHTDRLYPSITAIKVTKAPLEVEC